MSVVETCAVCGLDLHFVPGFKNGQGEYFHVFTQEKAGWYKRLHVPVPVLQDDLFEGEKEEAYVPAQGWSGEFRKGDAA